MSRPSPVTLHFSVHRYAVRCMGSHSSLSGSLFAFRVSCPQGKSAALGLAIAGAVGYGYSNIFVTAPSPENLKTVFEFVFKVTSIVGPSSLAAASHCLD